MTSRQILDRAVLRALNKDIRLAGNWEVLEGLAGNESLVVEHVAALSGASIDENKLTRALKNCRSIDEVAYALEQEQISTAGDGGTGSLF